MLPPRMTGRLTPPPCTPLSLSHSLSLIIQAAQCVCVQHPASMHLLRATSPGPSLIVIIPGSLLTGLSRLLSCPQQAQPASLALLVGHVLACFHHPTLHHHPLLNPCVVQLCIPATHLLNPHAHALLLMLHCALTQTLGKPYLTLLLTERVIKWSKWLGICDCIQLGLAARAAAQLQPHTHNCSGSSQNHNSKRIQQRA